MLCYRSRGNFWRVPDPSKNDMTETVFTRNKIGDLLLGGTYELLCDVRGSPSNGRILLGTKGICRFCGCNEPSNFRKIAHTFPEALGNKWVFSIDECDGCNDKFSLYEDSLANAVSPFLTLGGVKGKGGKTRQTGLTRGNNILARRPGTERPMIFATSTGADLKEVFSANPFNSKVRLSIPIAGVPFRPRHAYKALTKMGFALLPNEELRNYQRLQAWLLDINDVVDLPVLEVAVSFGSIGNAPPLVSGSLLRRVDPSKPIPHILFLFCAGSVCFQIDLLSDHMEDHLPPIPCGAINIKYSVVIGDDKGRKNIKIQYGDPVHQNWSSLQTSPQPIKAMMLDFNTETCEGYFTPIFR